MPRARLAICTIGFVLASGCGDDKAPCVTKVGSAGINATASACPNITSYDVEPSQVRVGGQVHLTAVAQDPNDLALAFDWTASAGNIEDPHAHATSFTCAEAGKPTITLTVSNGACDDTVSAPVECIAK